MTWRTVGDKKPLPPGPFVCVEPRGYETLARNLAEQNRWAAEARWRLDYYRRTLAPAPNPPPDKGKEKVNPVKP